MARQPISINDKVTRRPGCTVCEFKGICLPAGLDTPGTKQFERTVERQSVFAAGRPLYRAGDTARSAFAIRSGAVKTVLLNENGDERVIGFHLPGEVVGLENVFAAPGAYGVRAMQRTVACQIPLTGLVHLSARLPPLQHQLFRLLSREMRVEERLMRTIARHRAEQRLATFLADLAERLCRSHGAAKEFLLPMSRAELGSHLGIAQETVSRLFHRMADKGLIRVRGRHLRIMDAADVAGLANRNPPESSTEPGRDSTQNRLSD